MTGGTPKKYRTTPMARSSAEDLEWLGRVVSDLRWHCRENVLVPPIGFPYVSIVN